MPQPLSEVELLQIAVKAQRQQIKKLRKRLHAAKAERDDAKLALSRAPSLTPEDELDIEWRTQEAMLEVLLDIERGILTFDEALRRAKDALAPR